MSAPDRTLPPIPRLAIDFGPIIVFFVAYNLVRAHLLPVPAARAIYVATEATMTASLLAVGLSLWLTRKISAALILTSGLMLFFGGLTIALNDAHFVKIKPTINYALYATALLIGLIADRPLLKILLGPGLPHMAHKGWMKISRNFALFFIAMGCLNEFMWRRYSEPTWLSYDTWGVMIITALFMLSQYPIISKYMDEEPAPGEPVKKVIITPPLG